MAFTGPLEDRIAIRERMGTYADSAFQRDKQAWLANWSEDGVWKTHFAELKGKAALAEQWGKIWTHLDAMAFFTEVCRIEIDGDRAIARCYCREILALPGGAVRKVVGQYDDQLVKTGGEWLFSRRDYRLLIDEAN